MTTAAEPPPDGPAPDNDRASITEVCRLLQVHRSTFYRRYRNAKRLQSYRAWAVRFDLRVGNDRRLTASRCSVVEYRAAAAGEGAGPLALTPAERTQRNQRPSSSTLPRPQRTRRKGPQVELDL